MKKILQVLLVTIISMHCIQAQDEGAVVKRERITRDKSVFISGGVSNVLGNNFGDYSTGINFEGGYLRRLNRVVSIGGSISYLHFNYDPSILQKPPALNQDPVNFYFGYDINNNEIGSLLDLNGGDMTLISLAVNFKFNFVPVKDNTIISVYGFAKPFITSAKRGDISGTSIDYIYNEAASGWDPNGNSSGSYKGDSKISGGILLGPGVELYPGGKVSFFAQAAFGYTFPIDIVSTRSYDNDIANLTADKFPVSSLGFTSINFAAGVSFNLN